VRRYLVVANQTLAGPELSEEIRKRLDERHRWHTDLTPTFDVTCTTTGGDRAELRVVLAGPAGLDRLDQVTMSIRDDIRGRAPVTAGEPTAEQITRQVWGPYRFVSGVDGADETGRRVAPVELLLGDWRPFALERTLPPPWSSDTDGWRRQYANQPLRLTLTCCRQGHQPWTVPREIRIDRAPHP
jgi:hypothetical protein